MADGAEDEGAQVDMNALDEKMAKLTTKLEKARENFEYEKVQKILNKIDAHKVEVHKGLQQKLKSSEKKLEKAKKAKDAEGEAKYLAKIEKFTKKLADTHVGAGAWKMVDTSGPGAVRFANLPKETFRFVESTAYNATYDARYAYVPVQHNDLDCHIYKIDLTGEGDIVPEYVAHVLLKSSEKEDEDLTPFGCALSPEGVLWICMFNVNLVVGYDLVNAKVVGQVKCPAPNDVCISADGKTLWMGCGSRLGKVVLGGGAGTIWQASSEPPFNSTQVLDRGQGTMAGIEQKDGIVYCSHLQRMSAYDVGEDTAWRFWDGRAPEDDKFYLADNLAWWTPTHLLTPCYRELPGTVGAIMDEHADLGAAAWMGGRAVTFMNRLVHEGFSGVCEANKKGSNPECDLSLSKGDAFPDVHLSVYDLEKRSTCNYKIDCSAYEDFDGHVTHAQPAAGHIILVNFMYHKLMVVKMDAFPDAPALK